MKAQPGRRAITWLAQSCGVIMPLMSGDTVDYRGIPPKRDNSWRDEEFQRWRFYRGLFWAGLIALAIPIAFYFGPNLYNFGKLTWPTPGDFACTVETACVPTVRAIKQYEADTGHLPETLDDLVPKYLPTKPPGQQFAYGHFMSLEKMDHMVTYELAPGDETWRVSGPFARGKIPVPAVTLGPTRPPVTK
jgi:hypothetical protein